jgi:VWFA-related protein
MAILTPRYTPRYVHRLVPLLSLAVASALAQQQPPTPPAQQGAPASSTAPVQSAPAPAQPAPAKAATGTVPTSTAPTIKATAQLVVVDVVVTDSSQRPVHGLKASDFTLSENNTPQAIKNFEEHTALTQADATKFAPMPKLPPGIFTNYTPAPTNGAVNLVLLDALNTPMKDQAFVRQQLLAYLKSVPPGARIAIFGLTTHLIILQGFTSDPDALKDVMTKGLAKGSPLLDDQVGGGGIQNSTADDLEDAGGDPTVIANLRQFDAQQQSFQLTLRAQYTLDAMSQIARYLAAIPGRKNLIWFSGSFPVNILPDTTGTLPDPFAAMASSEDEFRDTVDLLARSQVAVYPIDARGLFNSPVFDASTSRNYGGAKGATRMAQDQSKFFNDTSQEHGTMLDMAAATGGHAFLNTNGLTKAVATAIDDGSNFYTLTYTPTNSARDGKLRKIKVKLARQGLTLAYRQGYYADDPNSLKPSAKPTDAAVTAASGPTARDTMYLAMTRGTPTPSEILIKVGVVPINSATQLEDKPAAGNMLGAKTHGPYRRYSVNYAIDPGGLAYVRTADGKIHTDFDLVIFVFDPNGTLVNSQISSVHLAATLEELKKILNDAIFRHEEVSAPAKGEYFLRIAIHDLHRDHYGAVEVATSQVRNVVPPTPPPPSSSQAPSTAPGPPPTASH